MQHVQMLTMAIEGRIPIVLLNKQSKWNVDVSRLFDQGHSERIKT